MNRPTINEIRAEALHRATTGQSLRNFGPIIEGFAARGIPIDEIEPRVNVLTYRAWQAIGRQVKKGEKGIRVATIAPVHVKDEKTGEYKRAGGRPWMATVFHISQTKPMEERPAVDPTDAQYEEECRQACGL